MIIRTTLTDTTDGKAEKNLVNDCNATKIDTEYIIEQCIERIMDMIKEENEK